MPGSHWPEMLQLAGERAATSRGARRLAGWYRRHRTSSGGQGASTQLLVAPSVRRSGEAFSRLALDWRNRAPDAPEPHLRRWREVAAQHGELGVAHVGLEIVDLGQERRDVGGGAAVEELGIPRPSSKWSTLRLDGRGAQDRVVAGVEGQAREVDAAGLSCGRTWRTPARRCRRRTTASGRTTGSSRRSAHDTTVAPARRAGRRSARCWCHWSRWRGTAVLRS